MEVAVSGAREPETVEGEGALSPQQMVEIYRLMVLSRCVDDREILLKRQQKIYFQISGAGHEALQVAAALALRPGYDWFFPSIAIVGCAWLSASRLLTCCCRLSAPLPIRPAAAGRCQPTGAAVPLHIVSTSSSTTTQLLHAVGCAEAGRYFSRHPEAAAKPEDVADYRSLHDVEFPRRRERSGLHLAWRGFHLPGRVLGGAQLPALKTQKLPRHLPALKTTATPSASPVEINTPGGIWPGLVANFPNFFFAEVDGTDPEACLPAGFSGCSRPLPRRTRPRLCPRPLRCAPYSHSLSDDDKLLSPPQPSAKPTPCAIRWPRCRCADRVKPRSAWRCKPRSPDSSVRADGVRPLRRFPPLAHR